MLSFKDTAESCMSKQDSAAETEDSLWFGKGWVTPLTKAACYWESTHTHSPMYSSVPGVYEESNVVGVWLYVCEEEDSRIIWELIRMWFD